MQLFSSLSSIRFRQDAHRPLAKPCIGGAGPETIKLTREGLPKGSNIHLALGSFDGLHLGHQALLTQMPLGGSIGDCCGALTFCPHPSKILRPQAPTALLMPYTQQEQHFRALGLNFLIRHPFDSTFAQTPPLAFLASLHRQIPNLTCLYVGEGFRFGRHREGDVHLMAEWARGAGLTLKTLTLLKKEGEPVSSSKIRKLIREGCFREANGLLGYAYYAQGRLEAEAGGFYVPWVPELQPPQGIYKGFLPALGESINLRYHQGKVLLEAGHPAVGKLLGADLKIEFTSLIHLC